MANGFNNRVLNFNQKKYNLGNLENNNNTNKHNNQATSNNVPGISVDDYNKQFENNQIDPRVQEFNDRQILDDVEKQSIIAELTNATKSNKEKYAQEITDSEELKTRQKNEDRFLQAKIQAVTMSKTVFELEKKLNEIDKKRDKFYSKSYEEQKQVLKAVEEQEEKMQKEKEFRDKINKPNVYLHSFATGMMEPLENIADGVAMTGGYVVSGFVSIFDEESSLRIKEDVSSFVNYDITDEAYAMQMRKMGVSDELAYGKGHEISKMCGTMFGYVSLTVVTGGIASSYGSAAGMSTTAIQTMSSLSTGTVSAFAAAGSSGETALRNGVSFDDAAKVSFIAGGAGFVAGAALDKLGVAAKGAKTLKGIAGYSALGGVTATSEPIINSVAEYHIYGKDMIDENGEKLYQSFGDYYKKSGGLMNTIMAGGIGIGSVGAQAFSGYRANNTKNAKNISSVLDDSLSTKNSSSYVDNMATEKLINFDDSSRTVDLFATEKLVKNEKLDFGDTVDLLDDQDYVFKPDLDSVPDDFKVGYKEFFDSQSNSIKMKKSLGESLENIFDTDNYVIGIHKAGISDPNSIILEGLRLSGDSGSGVAFNGIDLNNNIVFEQPSSAKDADFLRFCKNIEGSAGYKTVNGQGNAIIVKIPKADFNDISKLTIFDGTQYILKNDYIAGYVKTTIDDAGNVVFDNLTYKKDIFDNINNKNITDKLIFTEKLVEGDQIKNKLDFGDTQDLLITEKLYNKIDLFATEELIKSTPINLAILNDFEVSMNRGLQSDYQVINLAKKSFQNALESGNDDALKILNKLIKLKDNNPRFHFAIIDNGGSYWDNATSELVMSSKCIKWDDIGTFNHEMGHALFDMALQTELPNNWDDIVVRAQKHSSYNANLRDLNTDFAKYKEHTKALARQDLELQLNDMFSSIPQWENELTNSYANLFNLRKDQVYDILTKHDFPEDVIDQVLDGTLTARDLAKAKIDVEIRAGSEKFDRIVYGNAGAISDMLDALYEGKGIDLNGYFLPQTYGHGRSYFTSDKTNPFHETIANFTQIKMSGSKTALDNIKAIFGEEYYNVLENVFSKLKQ